jgi:hypothetical protein
VEEGKLENNGESQEIMKERSGKDEDTRASRAGTFQMLESRRQLTTEGQRGYRRDCGMCCIGKAKCYGSIIWSD